MASGTGLPIPKSGEVRTEPQNVVDINRYTSAQDWAKVAEAGAKIANSAEAVARLDEHQQQVGYLAEQDTEIARKRLELRDQFANDPQGFDAAWKGYTDGKLGAAQPWSVNHLRRVLGNEGNSAYGAILGERRARDQRLAGEKIATLATQTGSDVIGSAMAGTLNTPDGGAKIETYRNVLQSAVTAGLHPQEWADYHLDDTLSKAHGEEAARSGVQVYRERGFEAAVDHLRRNILENETLSLKPEARHRAFSRGMQALRLERQQDAQDKQGIVAESRDLRARIDSGQTYDPGEVRDTVAALARVGAMAEHRQLVVADAVRGTTRGASLPELRDAAAGRRAAVGGPRAGEAMQFFVGKGYSPAQAAGIVGNLIQESGANLDPTLSHDAGTGIGIAGWRLERRQALRQFAATRGTTETDFRTQLEFVDHELRTSEGRARDELSRARTPAEAARAFLHFERPQGYTPDRPEAGHGFSSRVRNAQSLAGSTTDAEQSPYAGEIAKQTQGALVTAARAAWPQFRSLIDRGQRIDGDDFEAIREAAALSGDRKWQEEVESAAIASRFGRAIEQLPEGERQAALDQLRAELKASNLPAVAQDRIQESVARQFERTNKQVREDQVGYAIERGGKPPAPLDLSSPQAASAGIQERVAIARGVAEDQGVPPGNPFRPAERATLAGAIATGKIEQAAVAFNALAGLPDEMLTPALASPEIKNAVAGAARSADGTRFNHAMLFLDRVWARAPETANALFGDDTIHQLMTWQTNLRYMSPEQLAADRAKNANDPQVRERRKVNEQAGRELARKEYKIDQIVGQFDSSWWITPGVVARNLTGTQPLPPADPLTRDALMGDFETLFARRYADTLDKDAALKQTVELLKTKWTRSEVNGGRLMLNAPETLRDGNGNPVYPAVRGSWGWMTQQIEGDIAREVGKPIVGPATVLGEKSASLQQRNWTYSLISDRQTQAEAQAGRPASYQVMVTDTDTGRVNVLPRRFAFDPTKAVGKSRADFEAQRARTLEQQSSLRDTLLGSGQEFPEIRIPMRAVASPPTRAEVTVAPDMGEE